MHIRILLMAALVALSLPAAAEFTTVARAYEIALSNFQVPVTRSGTVTFRTCAECDAMVVRMSPNLTLFVNGEHVELKEFRKRVFQVRDRANETIIVKHHLQSDTITSLKVTL